MSRVSRARTLVRRLRIAVGSRLVQVGQQLIRYVPVETGQHPPERDDLPPRVLVVSVPKAGTYFVGALLEQAGLHASYLHLDAHRCQAYDARRLTEGLHHPRWFDVDIPIDQSVRLIRSGEFAVSHLPWSPGVAAAVAPLRLVFVTRDLRSAILSWTRFILAAPNKGRNIYENIVTSGAEAFLEARGARYLGSVRKLVPWIQHPGVLRLRMDDLVTSCPVALDRLMQQIGADPVVDPEAFVEAARSRPSLTHVPARPKGVKWTPRCERLFAELGGIELNRALGHEPD